MEYINLKRTWVIESVLPVTFFIQYSRNVFDCNNKELSTHVTTGRAIVVIDAEVYKLYGTKLESYFNTANIELKLCIIQAVEENKDWKNTDIILKFFEECKILRRSEPVIAIGGGVLLDIVGFCASLYRRGIPYLKVPTTLLAMIDASVGSKVGINHMGFRNRIGNYYPPIGTLLDATFINTQSQSEISNGLAEIFKVALIKNSELFNLLVETNQLLICEKFQSGAIPNRVINLAISSMVEELEPNLWEKKLDRCVDFGHSFSPLIEMKNLPNMSHGVAVMLDCLFSSCLACVRGYINKDTLTLIFQTAINLRLPTYHDDFTDIHLLTRALNDTMKHRNNNQYLPIPIDIGKHMMVNDVTNSDLLRAIELYTEMGCQLH